MIERAVRTGRASRSIPRVVAFALPALIGILMVAAVIAWKQELFVSRTPIYVFTENALGITSGMPVKVFGITVGAVSDVTIVPGSGGTRGRVRVELEVKSEQLQHIAKDAHARLLRESLVGQSVIEILPGSGQARPIARNEVLVFERSKSVGEIAEELNHMLAPTLAQVKEFVGEIKSQGGEAQKTLVQVTTLLQELPESNRQLRKTLSSAERAFDHVDSALGDITQKAGGTLDNMQRTAAAVEAAAPGVLKKIESAAESAAQTADSVRRLSEGAAARVPLLLDSGAGIVRDVDDIVGGAKRSWPLRNLVSPPAEVMLQLDSQEASRPGAGAPRN